MYIKEIKIIKRNKKDPEEKPEIVSQTVKVKRDLHYQMVDEVNNWIAERSENRRAEKVFSDNKILDWKMFTNDLSKTTL